MDNVICIFRIWLVSMRTVIWVLNYQFLESHIFLNVVNLNTNKWISFFISINSKFNVFFTYLVINPIYDYSLIAMWKQFSWTRKKQNFLKISLETKDKKRSWEGNDGTWRWLAMLWRVRQSIPISSKILEGTALSTPSCSTACTNRLCSSGVQSTYTQFKKKKTLSITLKN